MYKTPTFAEPQQCNRPFSTGQLSAFIIQLVTWQVLTRSKRKNKISCNKNAIKNTEIKKNYQKQVPVGLTYNPTVRLSDGPIVRQMLYFFES
jgi:hypothetical protein